MRRPINRFVVLGLVFAGLGFLDTFVTIVLSFVSVGVGPLADAITPDDITVALFLVPTFYVVGVVLAIIGFRRSAAFGGRGLATTGIVVNSVLLTVGVLVWVVGTLIGQYLSQTLRG
jgi:hypothetical protein